MCCSSPWPASASSSTHSAPTTTGDVGPAKPPHPIHRTHTLSSASSSFCQPLCHLHMTQHRLHRPPVQVVRAEPARPRRPHRPALAPRLPGRLRRELHLLRLHRIAPPATDAGEGPQQGGGGAGTTSTDSSSAAAGQCGDQHRGQGEGAAGGRQSSGARGRGMSARHGDFHWSGSFIVHIDSYSSKALIRTSMHSLVSGPMGVGSTDQPLTDWAWHSTHMPPASQTSELAPQVTPVLHAVSSLITLQKRFLC